MRNVRCFLVTIVIVLVDTTYERVEVAFYFIVMVFRVKNCYYDVYYAMSHDFDYC